MAVRVNSRKKAEADLFVGQTVRVILTSGTTVNETSTLTQVVAAELANNAATGYTSRPSVTVTAAMSPAYDTTNKRATVTVTGLTLTAGTSALNYQYAFFILGGLATIGDTTGTLYAVELNSTPQSIPANTPVTFPLTIHHLDTNAVVGV